MPWLKSSKKKALAALDLTPVRKSICRKYGWTAPDARAAEFNYRKFWERLIDHPKEAAVAPNDQVDLFWMEHALLDAERYERDCRAVFGGFLFRPPRSKPLPAPRAAAAPLPLTMPDGLPAIGLHARTKTPSAPPMPPIVRFAEGSDHGAAIQALSRAKTEDWPPPPHVFKTAAPADDAE